MLLRRGVRMLAAPVSGEGGVSGAMSVAEDARLECCVKRSDWGRTPVVSWGCVCGLQAVGPPPVCFARAQAGPQCTDPPAKLVLARSGRALDVCF